MFDLSGKRALVTGGGTGIGRAFAEGLAAASADVVIAGRRGETLEAAADAMRGAGASVQTVVCDVTKDDDRAALREQAGRIDILVNNAGTSDRQPWTSVSASDWDRVLRLNLDATFALAQLFAPGMVERRYGRIINVASVWANRAPDPARYAELPSMDVPAYGTSKAGLLGLTRHLASVLAPDGVTVNAISPGMIETELTRQLLTQEVTERLEVRTPIGRLGRPDDLKAAVVFLASEEAAFVTGIDLLVDGGFSLW